MKKIIQKCVLFIFCLPSLVIAHGPSRILITEEIEINARPEQIWSVIKDFCSIKDWHPDIKNCTNDRGNEPESLRVITLENGEQIKEILGKHKPERFMIQHYMKSDQQLKTYPISTHSLTITITNNAGGDGSILKWKGAFYRSFQGPNPPPELSDATAQKKLTSFYRTGLENIKKLSE